MPDPCTACDVCIYSPTEVSYRLSPCFRAFWTVALVPTYMPFTYGISFQNQHEPSPRSTSNSCQNALLLLLTCGTVQIIMSVVSRTKLKYQATVGLLSTLLPLYVIIRAQICRSCGEVKILHNGWSPLLVVRLYILA